MDYNSNKVSNSNKYDYPIFEYQEKFKANYSLMKSSLANVGSNITNYKNEISKLEEYLNTINEHEVNYKGLVKKYTSLKKVLDETMEIEEVINKLSMNQQVINVSEYVNMYQRVRDIIKYFNDSHLSEKEDYINNMKKLMYKGFKTFEDTFYIILRRYDQLDSNQGSENEKINLLNKIKSLAECLQDNQIQYDFTSKLISDRSEKITRRLEENVVNYSRNVTEDNYEKNASVLTTLLIESEKLFQTERAYINKIFETCHSNLTNFVYAKIIYAPSEYILNQLKEVVQKHQKSVIKRLDFYTNIDILDLWYNRIQKIYKEYMERYNNDIYVNITNVIKLIEKFAQNYVDNFMKELNNFNEKIETENVLTICNQTVQFLAKLLQFPIAFEFIQQDLNSAGKEFSLESIIDTLVKKLEVKSSLLDKKYAPLKYIFVINNVFFVQSKLAQKPFLNLISKQFLENLSEKIRTYIEGYVMACWNKVDEITFNEKENLILFEQVKDKTLSNPTRETIKKKFANFNEQMKINLKFQQRIKIIDNNIEKMLINSNIELIVARYQDFYNKFGDSGFTKFRNKYILYSSGAEVTQDLKLYFTDSLLYR